MPNQAWWNAFNQQFAAGAPAPAPAQQQFGGGFVQPPPPQPLEEAIEEFLEDDEPNDGAVQAVWVDDWPPPEPMAATPAAQVNALVQQGEYVTSAAQVELDKNPYDGDDIAYYVRRGLPVPKEPIMDIETTRISKIVNFMPVLENSLAKVAYEQFVQKLDALSLTADVVPRPKVPELTHNAGVRVGIEIEIENQLSAPINPKLESPEVWVKLRSYFWQVWEETEDHSLRNTGKEYVTKPGLTAGEAPYALALLKLYLSCYFPNSELNYRCGTHIHIEVRELTVAQIINMTCLYILFEDLFYKISGERYTNIFCVPIRASISEVERIFKLVQKEKPTYADFRSNFKHFKKYMAYNLLPVTRGSKPGGDPLGTVEFRHHKGESDPKVLTQWIQTIADIHHAAQQFSYPTLQEIIFNLNRRADYLGFAEQVFTKLPDNVSKVEIISDMYAGSGYIKELYLQSKGLQ